MHRYLTRAVSCLVAAALAASTMLLTATPAQAADGTLVVNVVDQYGRPTVGSVTAYDSSGDDYYPAGAASDSLTFTVPAGGYSFATYTTWSGISCDGASPCAIGSGPTAFTPVVTVSDGGSSTYTLHVTVPSISGNPAVGSALTVQIPQGLRDLITYLSAYGYGDGGDPTAQWLRGGTDIAGATSSTYTTTRDDGSQQLSARLTPTAGMNYAASSLGTSSSPLTTNAITVAKFVKTKTKTKTSSPKRVGVNQRASVKVKVKAKKSQEVPDGFVTLAIGKFKTRKALKRGSAFFTLPSLKAGTYTITAKYAGTEVFTKSKAKKVTIIVHK